MSSGRLNCITDVAGVTVGHETVIQGENVRTGVTAVFPHAGNLFRAKVPGAIFVGNGFGNELNICVVRKALDGQWQSLAAIAQRLNILDR